MFSWATSWFANPAGLWAALALIPLLIVYLIRPKPQQKTIPSLMFLMRDRDKKRFNALFQALVREFLLLVHILILVGLVAALAQPFLSVPATQAAADTVIVLDDSASLYATEDGTARYHLARQQALDAVGRQNTIILAGAIPRVAVEGVSADRARAYLRDWVPSHQPLRLTSSILASQEFFSADGRVVVISTFHDTDMDNDYRQALATVRSAGADVSIRQVGTPGTPTHNVGIVDANVGESSTRVEVQNYFDKPQSVRACVEESCTTLQLEARDVTDWSFTTPPGITRVYLDIDDQFSLDNELLIVSDARRTVRTLVVTNEDFEDSYLFFALRSIERSTPLSFEYTISTPPQLVDSVNHDLIIFYEVDPTLLVGRTVRESAGRVAAGGAAIVMAQDALFGLGLDGLLPLSYEGDGGASVVVNTQERSELSDIDFGSTPSYYQVTPARSLQTLAVAADDTPLIALSSLGQGRVLYYGLSQDASFSLDPLYPVFWRHSLNALLDRRAPQDINFRTGERISVSQASTPDGRSVSGNVLLTSKGLYETPAGAISANLLHPRVSDVSVPVLSEAVQEGYSLEAGLSEQDISSWILWAVLVLLLAEVFYLKWRGDA